MPRCRARSMSMDEDGRMPRVIVAGGGIAALESLAGVAALARSRVETTRLAPVTEFSYRPLSTAVAFAPLRRRSRSLPDLAEQLGARFVRDGLAAVDQERGRVLTHDGEFLDYDALVVAVGAVKQLPADQGQLWLGDDESMAAFGRLLRE